MNDKEARNQATIEITELLRLLKENRAEALQLKDRLNKNNEQRREILHELLHAHGLEVKKGFFDGVE
jgi:hypothetical protein